MPGGQNWMTVQYQEELTHAQKMFDYVIQRGGRVKLEAIAKPAGEWPDGLSMFKEALAHEEGVTAAHLRRSPRWRSTSRTTPPTTSCSGSSRNRWRRKRAPWTWSRSSPWPGEHPAGLYDLDKELAARVFTPPAPAP